MEKSKRQNTKDQQLTGKYTEEGISEIVQNFDQWYTSGH